MSLHFQKGFSTTIMTRLHSLANVKPPYLFLRQVEKEELMVGSQGEDSCNLI